MIVKLGCVLSLFLAGTAWAQEPPLYETRSNIVYGSYSGLALLMDVKLPAASNGLAILHVPGSGFQAPLGMEPYQIKDPAYHLPVEEPLLEQGFTVFTINHRAAPRFSYPAPLEDVQRAARFIRTHAKDFGVSAEWLGAMGESSGGQLALLLGTRGEGLEKPASLAGGPVAQCVVAVMAPSDLLPLGQDGWAVALVTQFTGTVAPFPEEAGFPGYSDRLAPFIDASPITYLTPETPSRFLLLHGDADKLVPIDQSQRFYAAGIAKGVRIDFQTMPGIGHNFPAPYTDQAATWMSECAASSIVAVADDAKEKP